MFFYFLEIEQLKFTISIKQSKSTNLYFHQQKYKKIIKKHTFLGLR